MSDLAQTPKEQNETTTVVAENDACDFADTMPSSILLITETSITHERLDVGVSNAGACRQEGVLRGRLDLALCIPNLKTKTTD